MDRRAEVADLRRATALLVRHLECGGIAAVVRRPTVNLDDRSLPHVRAVEGSPAVLRATRDVHLHRRAPGSGTEMIRAPGTSGVSCISGRPQGLTLRTRQKLASRVIG